MFCDCTCWASKKILPGGRVYLEGLEGCLTVKNSWWEFTGDDGVGFEGLLFYILSIHIPSNDFSVFVEIYDVPRSIVCCTILELLFGMWSTL